jgi:ATP-dependent RNA helicase RhlE
VHRIGRTGRAGREGEAISLVCVDELKLLKDIERLIKREIPKRVIEGYQPDATIKAEPIVRGRPQNKNKPKRHFHQKGKGQSTKTAAKGGNHRYKPGRRAAA